METAPTVSETFDLALVEQVAQVCHEANRSYCQTIGDNSQPLWGDAPEWQRDSARQGVKFHFTQLDAGIDPPASASHDKWLEQKLSEGWQYGPTKDVMAKKHPCCVPYEQLPMEQRRKDYIFASICRAFHESKSNEV